MAFSVEVWASDYIHHSEYIYNENVKHKKNPLVDIFQNAGQKSVEMIISFFLNLWNIKEYLH